MRHPKSQLSAAETIVRSLPLEALAQIPEIEEVGSRVLAESCSSLRGLTGEVVVLSLHESLAGHVHAHCLDLSTPTHGSDSLPNVVEG